MQNLDTDRRWVLEHGPNSLCGPTLPMGEQAPLGVPSRRCSTMLNPQAIDELLSDSVWLDALMKEQASQEE